MIKKTFHILSKITKDKLLHFFYGSVLGFIFVLPFSWFGIMLTLQIAVVKECIDFIFYDNDGRYYKAKEGLLDILYTTMPSILFYIIALVYQN